MYRRRSIFVVRVTGICVKTSGSRADRELRRVSWRELFKLKIESFETFSF
jgi:hypothetical protein